MAKLILPVLTSACFLCGCAALVQSRPDLINRGIAAANVDCTSVSLSQREQCARDEFARIYPAWHSDMNGDLIEDAFSAMGRLSTKEASGALTEQQGEQLWQSYYASLIQIADSRLTNLQERREAQAAALQRLGESMQAESAILQQSSPVVTHCSSSAFVGTVQTTCTQN